MLPLLLTSLGVLVVLVVFVLVLVARFYRKVDQGFALIVNTMKDEPTVTFTGAIVIPVLHRAEVMDISVKTIEIDRRGKDGLICQDNIRADIKVTFFVRVNKTTEDVLKVAQSIGCARASDPATLEELFVAKFGEALKTVGKQLDFEDLYTKREKFRDDIIDIIGKDLNGYVLEDAAIDYLEQTPIEMLDKENILDARGIRKITEITAEQNVSTNDLRQEERKAITKQNLEADEAILELDRRRADAEAKQKREIETVKAREAAETEKVKAEERKRSEMARIKADEEIEISSLNKQRQVEVADKDRERVVAIKSEQVERDRQLEAISRNREVELQEIDKEKAIEVQKKEIADVIRTRIAVEKNVAEEEERIKDLRATAEARRSKDVTIIAAEAEAEEALVKDLKAAEAKEKAAEFAAREKLTMAQAALEASDKEATAKIRMAEGVKAEAAAAGLADVMVREADAEAIKKQGMAQAEVTREQMSAEADGLKVKGMAEVEIKNARVDVTEREGMVGAAVTRERMLAEARGTEEKGMAHARVLEAEAVALEKRGVAEAVAREKMGLADAVAVREKMTAEATGLAEKAEAMKKLDGVAREHEEFRLQLEKAEKIQLAEIAARREIAEAQAKVLAEAFGSSEIKIVGGDGAFFDRFVKAASMGHSIDGFVNSSESVQSAFKGYLGGGADLGQDVKALMGEALASGENLKNLSLTALLTRLMASADGDLKGQLASLLSQAKQLEDSGK